MKKAELEKCNESGIKFVEELIESEKDLVFHMAKDLVYGSEENEERCKRVIINSVDVVSDYYQVLGKLKGYVK